MATSGTYNFNPSFGELAAQAYRRLGLPRQALTADHLLDAQNEANLMLLTWANKGPNLWSIEELTIPLLEGIATYDLPAETVDMLDVMLSYDNPDGTRTDRIMQPISRTEYASYSVKSEQGTPSTFWMSKLVQPTVTIFPTPSSDDYTLRWYRLRWQQDVDIANAMTVDVQRLWLNAFVAGLAAALSVIYKPDAFQMLTGIADQQWDIAATENTETSALYIVPGLGSYYR
jgi:hypothetical protein